MPYYYITIIANGRRYGGVKFDHLTDPDAYAQKAYRAAITRLKCQLTFFEVVMLCTNSPVVRQHLEKRRNGSSPYHQPEF